MARADDGGVAFRILTTFYLYYHSSFNFDRHAAPAYIIPIHPQPAYHTIPRHFIFAPRDVLKRGFGQDGTGRRTGDRRMGQFVCGVAGHYRLGRSCACGQFQRRTG